MAIQLTEKNGGKVLEVRASGKLTHADYQQFTPAFERLIQAHGKIRILFEMADFHGWEAGAVWDDIKLDMKHFRDIERLALLGETRWEKGMSVFCKPFTTAEVRYFDRAQAARRPRGLPRAESLEDSPRRSLLRMPCALVRSQACH